MLQVFEGVAVRSALGFAFLASFIFLLAAAELAFPREEQMTTANRVRVIVFAAIYIPAANLFGTFVRVPAKPVVVNAALAILVIDFLYYWYHRAQHAIPWLWKVHAVHHSIEKMGAGAGYHHLLEVPLKGMFVTIPAALIFGQAGIVAGFVVTLHSFYVHSTTRINFGSLAWLVCDNRVHRIHHSREAQHFDKNFGVLTLVWDRLFGTAFMPHSEWPEVGLVGQREPTTIMQYLGWSGRSKRTDPGLRRRLTDGSKTILVNAAEEGGNRPRP